MRSRAAAAKAGATLAITKADIWVSQAAGFGELLHRGKKRIFLERRFISIFSCTSVLSSLFFFPAKGREMGMVGELWAQEVGRSLYIGRYRVGDDAGHDGGEEKNVVQLHNQVET